MYLFSYLILRALVTLTACCVCLRCSISNATLLRRKRGTKSSGQQQQMRYMFDVIRTNSVITMSYRARQ